MLISTHNSNLVIVFIIAIYRFTWARWWTRARCSSWLSRRSRFNVCGKGVGWCARAAPRRSSEWHMCGRSAGTSPNWILGRRGGSSISPWCPPNSGSRLPKHPSPPATDHCTEHPLPRLPIPPIGFNSSLPPRPLLHYYPLGLEVATPFHPPCSHHAMETVFSVNFIVCLGVLCFLYWNRPSNRRMQKNPQAFVFTWIVLISRCTLNSG